MLNDLFARLDPVAFTVFGLDVRWYGLAYLVGFVIAGLVVYVTVRAWDIELSVDDLYDVLLAAALGVMVGGRLGYVLFYGDGYYLQNPAQILAFRDGGMSFHGGLVGVLVAGALVSRVKGIAYLTLADLGAIAAPLGLFFGRIANFVNGELWGTVTELPWGVVFPGAGPLPRHPSQLYEAVLEGLVMFVVLFALSRRRPVPARGTFIGWMLVMYGSFRFLVEFVREPDAQLGYLFGSITMGQLLSIPLIVAGAAVLVVAKRRGLPQAGRRVRDTSEETRSSR